MADNILAQYLAGRRGGSNVYGGPQMRQPVREPAPAPRPSVSRGGGSTFEKMVAEAAAKKKQESGAQAAQDLMGSLEGNGGGIGGFIEKGLGTVLGGAASALGGLGRMTVAGLDNLAGTSFGQAAQGIGGAGNILAGFNTADNDTQESFLDRVRDPSFGYGTAMKTTGNKWGDRVMGFVGDVAYDPLTYVGGAATKSAMGTDRMSREAMAQILADAGRSDEIIGKASKYGAAFLDAADRELVGARAPGLYFGVGESSFQVPGTERLGSALEKGGARLRTGTISKITNPANLKMRTQDELKLARRVMNAGRTIDGVTPSIAAERLRFASTVDRVMRSFVDPHVRDAKSLLTELDDDAARWMTRAIEDGAPEGAQLGGLYKKLHQSMLDAGVDVGTIDEFTAGLNYMPHRFRPEGWEWMKNTPEGQAAARQINVDPLEDVTALRKRVLKAGSKIEGPGGKFTVGGKGTIDDINEAFSKAFPGAPKILEDDARVLTQMYIGEVGKSIGLRQAFKQLSESKSGVMQALDGMAVEQLDELASVTANKTMKKTLKKVAKERTKKLAARRQSAEKAVEEFRKGLMKDLDEQVTVTAKEAKGVRGELKVIKDELGKIEPDGRKIEAQFGKMRNKIDQERERILGEMYDLDETIAATRAELDLKVTPMGGESTSTALQQRLDTLEVARARLQDQLDGAADVQERIDGLYASMYEVSSIHAEWQDFADSPQLVAEEASRRSATTDTVTSLERVDDPNATAWSDSLQARITAAEAPEAQQQAAEKALRDAGRAGEVAQAQGAALERINAEMSANLASQSRMQALIAQEEPAWVPLSLKAKRRRLMDKILGKETSIEEAKAAERAVMRDAASQVRAGREAADEAATALGELSDVAPAFKEADAALWENNARQVGESENKAIGGLVRKQQAADEAARDHADLYQRYYDLGTRQMELQKELDDVQFEQIDVDWSKADASRDRAATLAEQMISTRAELADVEDQILAASLTERQRQLVGLEADYRELQDKAARLASSKRWHEELAKRPLASGNSVKTLKAQKELALKLERNESFRNELKQMVTRTVETRKQYQTEGRLNEYADWLRAEIADLKASGPEMPDISRVPLKGREVTDEEFGVVSDYIKELSQAERQAESELRALKNERAKKFPDLTGNRSSGIDSIDQRDFTYGGTEVGGQTLTKEEYDYMGGLGMTEPSSQRGMRRSARGAEQVTDEFDDNVTTFDGVMDFESAADIYLDEGRRELWDLNERIKQAQDTLSSIRQTNKRAMRRYGLDGTLGEGYAYGGAGNVLLVDTNAAARKAAGGRWNAKNTLAMTEQDLLDEIKRRGMTLPGGKRPKHGELAAMLGWEARLKRPGTKGYEAVPQGFKDAADRMALRDRIRALPPEKRNVLNAAARSRAMDEYRQHQLLTRTLEVELGKAEADIADVAAAREAAQAQADHFAARTQGLVEDIGRVEDARRNVEVAEQGVRRFQQEEAKAGEAATARRTALEGQEREAVARQQVLSRQADALDAVEKQVGKHEADAIRDLTVERAVKGMEAGVKQNEVWRAEGREKAAKALKNRVPKQLKQGSTGRQVRQRLESLNELVQAAKSGDVELGVAADLALAAERAVQRLDQEESFIKGLQRMERLAAKGSRVGAKERLETITHLAAEGFTQIENKAFPEGADFGIQNEMARMLGNFKVTLQDEKQWLKYYDQATQFFKTYATATPGFHVRNLMSAVFMNMTEGVSAGTHTEAFRKWQEYVKVAESAADIDEWFAKQTPEWRQAFSTVFGSGTGGMFSDAEIGAKLGVTKWIDNPITRFSQRVGEDYVEGPVRLALGLHYTRRGAGIESALAQVNRIHFNYADVSNMDKTMKRIIPFWTFMSRNMPMQVEQMWKKPRAYAIFNHAVQNFDDGQDGDIMPQWMERAGGFFIGRDIPWLGGGSDAVLTPDMPHLNMAADVRDLVDQPSQILSSMNPLIKIPYEQLSKRSTFTGAPILEGEDGNIQGRLQHALENMVPFITQGERLSGTGRYEGKQTEKVLNYLGVPLRAVGDREVASELRRRAYDGN